MQFLGDPVTEKGVYERRFDLAVDGRTVPGIVWSPVDAVPSEGAPRPVVLIGHGGSLHKRTPYVLSLARRLVRHHDIAAVAIDGPVHGDRVGAADRGDDPSTWWTDSSTDDMIADWQATLAAVQALDEIGNGRVGYWGLSMGTIFGLPLVAAEPRIDVAVLGLMGVVGLTERRIKEDAGKITCPVLFLQQWNDELFSREAAFTLFDSLATTDKRLHANPGAHSAVPPEEIDASEAFLASHLTA